MDAHLRSYRLIPGNTSSLTFLAIWQKSCYDKIWYLWTNYKLVQKLPTTSFVTFLIENFVNIHTTYNYMIYSQHEIAEILQKLTWNTNQSIIKNEWKHKLPRFGFIFILFYFNYTRNDVICITSSFQLTLFPLFNVLYGKSIFNSQNDVFYFISHVYNNC